MGKLFKLALEEAVVEEPSIVENVPVEKAVQNAEELAKTDSEIQQDITAVEELMEEKAKLEDQAVTNDELLSNPDAVVTATDTYSVELDTIHFQNACFDIKDLITEYMLPSLNSIIITHEVMVELVRHEMTLLGMR